MKLHIALHGLFVRINCFYWLVLNWAVRSCLMDSPFVTLEINKRRNENHGFFASESTHAAYVCASDRWLCQIFESHIRHGNHVPIERVYQGRDHSDSLTLISTIFCDTGRNGRTWSLDALNLCGKCDVLVMNSALLYWYKFTWVIGPDLYGLQYLKGNLKFTYICIYVS